MNKFDITKYNNIFSFPKNIEEPYGWIEHIPFAFFIINVLKPKLFVELGVHSGNSYNAFCQAVEELKTKTICYGVDTWQGDEHAEYYTNEIFFNLNRYQQKNYKHFSNLLKMKFNDALVHFSNKSIDLLHIDGYHTYDAVKHDYKNWLPKMSDNGVIIFHDTAERSRDFGVWKLWEEISVKYPSINFTHSHGLGIIAVGKKADKTLINFLNDFNENIFYQNYFFKIGNNIKLLIDNNNHEEAISHYILELSKLTELIKSKDLEIKQKKELLAIKEEEIEKQKITINTKNNIIEKFKENFFSELLIDIGSGYTDNASIKKIVDKKCKCLKFNLSQFPNIESIRFDPLNKPVKIKLEKIILTDKKGGKYQIIEYDSNTEFRENDIMIFPTDDSNIYINKIDKNTIYKQIEFHFNFILIGQEVLQNIINYLKLKYEKEIKSKESYQTNMNKILNEKDNQILYLSKKAKWSLANIKDIFKKTNNYLIKLFNKMSPFIASIDSINYIEPIIDKAVINVYKEIAFIIIKGWCCSRNKNNIIEKVYISINNNHFDAHYGELRQDVATYYKRPDFKFSGYICNIPLDKIKIGLHKISIKVKFKNNNLIKKTNKNIKINIKTFKDLDLLSDKPSYKLFSLKTFTDNNSENTINTHCINDNLIIRGWAIDKLINKNAGGVLIEINNKIYNSIYGEKKPIDGEEIDKNDIFINSGFSIQIPTKDIDLSKEYHDIKLYILNNSSTGYYIANERIKIKMFGNPYKYWIEKNEPNEDEIKKLKNIKFKISPKISLITPVYNTPKTFLIDMIESVLSQTYTNWELCLADGCSSKPYIKEILEDYSKKDKRIKVKFLKKNKGISENSNEAYSISTGTYIALLDHDDTLAPFALHEIVKEINKHKKIDFLYSDEDKISEDGNKRFDPHFKPNWSPDTFRSFNYPIHLSVFNKSVLKITGFFRKEYDGSQDYDLILRVIEKAKNIIHIPKILYHWRKHLQSTSVNLASKTYTVKSAKQALLSHLKRIDLNGKIYDAEIPSTYKIEYEIKDNPLISIIIPNKDNKDDLLRCIKSILNKSTYKNFEILIIENNSKEKQTFETYNKLKDNNKIRILEYNIPFNYSKLNNFAVKESKGDYILFLNNDTEVINNDWLERMLEFCIRKDVGAVGAKLYYPDDTLQHAGVIVGLGGVAGHSHKHYPKSEYGYFARPKIIQNLSAVTAACLMTKKDILSKIDGFDEKFAVAFNDVDLCLKIREKGYLIVWTPYSELYHYESKTRGAEDTPEKMKRFQKEINLFKKKWKIFLKNGDPYYNPNLTLDREDFSINV